MSRRNILFLLAGGVIFVGSLCAWQREFREYPAIEYNNFPLPEGAQRPAEWSLRGSCIHRRPALVSTVRDAEAG